MVMVTLLIEVQGKHMAYDMELPVNVPGAVLVNQIAEMLNEYRHGQWLFGQNKALYAKRLGRLLNPDETLEYAGIWNGDYLELREI